MIGITAMRLSIEMSENGIHGEVVAVMPAYS